MNHVLQPLPCGLTCGWYKHTKGTCHHRPLPEVQDINNNYRISKKLLSLSISAVRERRASAEGLGIQGGESQRPSPVP
jgi:hypothetical protein